MLVELGVVEQRHAAVLEVLRDGASVSEVALRFGVSRQTVHRWLRRYADRGLAGLADGSPRPDRCPHQMPGWGPRTLLFGLEARGVDPLPGRSSVYRCLVRHGLVVPEARKRKRSDYKRWERSRALELWQMDVVGGVMIADGSKASIITGLDDHSRFAVSAHVVERATSRPTCDALAKAMRAWGVPDQILTDNAKVFTGRFGPRATSEVLFDRICRENGIRHLLTAPRSPTTTGKVERFHKTLRGEFLTGKVFESIADAQTQIDGWVRHYNYQRRHQARPANGSHPDLTPCIIRPVEHDGLACCRRGSGQRARSTLGATVLRLVKGLCPRPFPSFGFRHGVTGVALASSAFVRLLCRAGRHLAADGALAQDDLITQNLYRVIPIAVVHPPSDP